MDYCNMCWKRPVSENRFDLPICKPCVYEVEKLHNFLIHHKWYITRSAQVLAESLLEGVDGQGHGDGFHEAVRG